MTAKSQPIFVRSKSGRRIEIPTPEENAAINAGIAADPDTVELDDAFFAHARRAAGFRGAESAKVDPVFT